MTEMCFSPLCARGQSDFQMGVCLVCLNCKVKLSLKRKIPCMFLELFGLFATIEINDFVPLGFGNWKIGTHVPSHSLVAGSEEGE